MRTLKKFFLEAKSSNPRWNNYILIVRILNCIFDWRTAIIKVNGHMESGAGSENSFPMTRVTMKVIGPMMLSMVLEGTSIWMETHSKGTGLLTSRSAKEFTLIIMELFLTSQTSRYSRLKN
jgi:hypothetical protein